MNRFTYIILIGLLAACSPIQSQRGQLVSDEELTQIKTGETAKPEVIALLGTPTNISAFDENQWYYIGEDTKQIGVNHPETVTRRVVSLKFDETGVLSEKSVLGKEDGQEVVMHPGATRVLSKEQNVLQQLIGNVGRFSKEGGGAE
ncbi:MAG TPA: outer membrane protein assembly factor BamE [Alphaproteobacteria bacterium]|nr:outer membrane protein assembly factor BamE [Rhodospirillaceae bacterium]HRJ12121.1 outer membrane protein assembly factor BamE [Alphaproteobacteria bacterium]